MTTKVLNILLVEDDEIDVVNVQRAFKRSNIVDPVHVATDGVEALEKLRDGTVPPGRRLVLLDLNMPRMSGLEFLRALRADPALRSTCVVVVTTSNHEQDRAAAYALNVAGYLVKPSTFAQSVEAFATVHKYWTTVETP